MNVIELSFQVRVGICFYWRLLPNAIKQFSCPKAKDAQNQWLAETLLVAMFASVNNPDTRPA
ncbi:hypothetical protein [Massilia genomosp. 1]|uniref:Transposase n=1 Tax=Massilia genomosp. 1 TaxID=2609280 RepID=A0ABX0MLZ7_9BURK|nr:hypothetical protein [Massilia genomosp. 1]NHZ63795.1 hypothetical protein [Massilia genomosp. 1]